MQISPRRRSPARARWARSSVERLTCALGAELSNVNLGVASRTPELVTEIRALLLQHECCSFATRTSRGLSTSPSRGTSASSRTIRSPPATRTILASCGSTPDLPTRPTTATRTPWHTDATWREKPPFGCVLRCVECPPVGGDTMWANMALAYEKLPEEIKARIAGSARAPQHRSHFRARQCRSRSDSR